MILGQDTQSSVIDEFTKLDSAQALLSFLQKKALKHDKYSHYSKEAAIKSIVEGKELYFSNVSQLNDLEEKMNVVGSKDQYWLFCFSHEVDENLGQWVMYGDRGKGARWSCHTTDIEGLLNDWTDKKITIQDDKKTFLDYSDCELSIYDVVYYRKNASSKKVNLFYDDIENDRFTNDEFECAKKMMPFVFKEAIWKYEHETRLVLRTSFIHANESTKLIVTHESGWEQCRQQMVYGPMSLKTDIDKKCAFSQYHGKVDIRIGE